MISGESFVPVEQSSTKHYEDCAHIFSRIAHSKYGIKLSDQTLTNWVEALGLMRFIDTALDDGSAIERDSTLVFLEALFNEGQVDGVSKNFVNPDLAARAESLFAKITPEAASNFLRKGKQLLRAEARLDSKNSSTAEAAFIKRLGGQITVGMLLAVTDSSDMQHENFGQFTKTIRRLTRIANVFDDSLDLKRDYKEGKTMVRPTNFNRTKIMYGCRDDIIFCAKELGFGVLKIAKINVDAITKEARGKRIDRTVGVRQNDDILAEVLVFGQ